MARQWTEAQKHAIEARGGSLLVSAAAGSGKTAVLVERVIERICDSSSPCDADRLLVVTFTRAAAAEMRSRIADEISKRLRENPGNSVLLRQQMLLPNAKICTIDSFCSSLVRENFEKLDVSPDFTTVDEARQSLLRQQAMDDTLEVMYRDGGPDFLQLSGMLIKGRDDSELAEAVLKLYDCSRAYPFPDRWLDSVAQQFDNDTPLSETYFGQLILDYVKNAANYCLHLIRQMKSLVSVDEKLTKSFNNCITSDETQLLSLRAAAESGDWSTAYETVCGFVFVTKGRVPKDFKDSDIDESLTAIRKTIKEKIISKLPEIMCSTLEEAEDDKSFFKKPVKILCETVKRFTKAFDALKAEKNLLDFSDIELLALSLLMTETEDGGYESTALAKELSQRYEEILIDEYQDTNEAQNMLFCALSRNEENLFRVGDVKQSIYRFRHAMPEIFLGIREKCSDYNAADYPAKLNLDCNFRSRSGVTGMVNFVFSQIMSKSAGEIEYDNGEALVAGAVYPPAAMPEAQLHLLDLDDADASVSTDMHEANYIASLIKKMLSSNVTVFDKGVERPLRRSDICVLMRALKGRGTTYADIFRQKGIPTFTETPTNFFAATEISTVLALLKVIDNPKQDIALLAVMLSPLFGFTPDEAALLRTEGDGTCLYSRAASLAKAGNEKYKALIDSLTRLRLVSATLCTDELIRRIYEETGYFAAVQAMSEGESRRANLLLLLDYASTYEEAGYIGLSGFIRFIDRLDSSKNPLNGSLAVSDSADVVRIMSIHKSKGLEFPVCILANCSGKFNRKENSDQFIIDPMHGIGMLRRDTETLAQFDTVFRSGASLSLKTAETAEQMRVLYVAMTRAKERLITVCALKKPEATLKRLAGEIPLQSNRLAPFAVNMAGSFSDWLLESLLRHPGCGELRKIAGVLDDCVLPSDTPVTAVIAKTKQLTQPECDETVICQPDERLVEKIRERLSYTYKYAALSGVMTKRTASDINSQLLEREYFATSRPAFLSESGLTAAQKGTAVHRFMQLCDYEKAANDFEREKARLCSLGLLSEAQAACVDKRRIQPFFESELYRRIRQSGCVYREKQFMIQLPLREMHPELPDYIDEKLLIQGVADCAFTENGGLVIVDYKTDKTDSVQQLCERYKGQMKIYARALCECTGLPVTQVLLWSFSHGVQADMTQML